MLPGPIDENISQEHRFQKVHATYEKLKMAEKSCIEADNAQSSQTHKNQTFNNQQWRELATFHIALLHRYHNFLLASQQLSEIVPSSANSSD